MGSNVIVFAIVVAAIIALTRIILSVMEYIDQSKGIITQHKEYKVSYLLKLIMLDTISPITDKIGERKRKREEKKKNNAGQ